MYKLARREEHKNRPLSLAASLTGMVELKPRSSRE